MPPCTTGTGYSGVSHASLWSRMQCIPLMPNRRVSSVLKGMAEDVSRGEKSRVGKTLLRGLPGEFFS
jgi:hypothetical protein